MEVIHKIGRRKTSVARAYISEGSGVITVNKKELSDYFPTGTLQYKVNQPFLLTENEGCLLYTSPSPRDRQKSRMPSSA